MIYRLSLAVPDHRLTRPDKNSWSSACEKAGYSCSQSLADVVALRAMMFRRSKASQLRHVATARLAPAMGKLARTGPNRHHVTLWLRTGHDVNTLFEILHEHDLEPS